MLRVFCLMLAAILAGCAAAPSPIRAPRTAAINHVVFFKLKDPGQSQELIRACDEQLRGIPGAVCYYAGTHFDIGRANIDYDYDVGFFIGFDSREAYEQYLTHPVHVELVNEWRPRWDWIRIYDVGDFTP